MDLSCFFETCLLAGDGWLAEKTDLNEIPVVDLDWDLESRLRVCQKIDDFHPDLIFWNKHNED